MFEDLLNDAIKKLEETGDFGSIVGIVDEMSKMQTECQLNLKSDELIDNINSDFYYYTKDNGYPINFNFKTFSEILKTLNDEEADLYLSNTSSVFKFENRNIMNDPDYYNNDYKSTMIKVLDYDFEFKTESDIESEIKKNLQLYLENLK